jgi:hypothetical protein
VKSIFTIIFLSIFISSPPGYAQDKRVLSKRLSCSVLIFSIGVRQPIQNCEITYEKDKRVTTNCFSGYISVEFSNDMNIDNQKYRIVKKIEDSLEKVNAISYIEDKELKILTNYEITIDFLQKEFKGRSVGPFGYSDISGSCF